jgi:hypothetical protein
MSTLTDLLQPAPRRKILRTAALERFPQATAEAAPWNPMGFAEEQIRWLVRQVFFPGWPKPARHVVFCAVDPYTKVAEICLEVGSVLSSQVSGSVCVIEANPHNPELESWFGGKAPAADSGGDGRGALRNSARRIASKLWLAPLHLLLGETGGGLSHAWLERRLSDFRLDFDYTVLHAPPAGLYSETAIIGRLNDGVALVIEAHRTRRVTAQKAKQVLQAANVKILGTVLSERTFPIPQAIYRHL